MIKIVSFWKNLTLKKGYLISKNEFNEVYILPAWYFVL
jgi:hypothetical protein